MSKQTLIDTYLYENKWQLTALNNDVMAKESYREYQNAIATYFYLKGYLETPFCQDKHYRKDFFKCLKRQFPYYQMFLTSDKFFNIDPKKPYRPVTDDMRWREIYKAVTLYKLPLLYEEYETKPIQQSLALGV